MVFFSFLIVLLLLLCWQKKLFTFQIENKKKFQKNTKQSQKKALFNKTQPKNGNCKSIFKLIEFNLDRANILMQHHFSLAVCLCMYTS